MWLYCFVFFSSHQQNSFPIKKMVSLKFLHCAIQYARENKMSTLVKIKNLDIMPLQVICFILFFHSIFIREVLLPCMQ